MRVEGGLWLRMVIRLWLRVACEWRVAGGLWLRVAGGPLA